MGEPRNLNRLAYFVAVVDHGGFTQAADRLGVNKGLVSRQVASLEEEVGAHTAGRTDPGRARVSPAGDADPARSRGCLR